MSNYEKTEDDNCIKSVPIFKDLTHDEMIEVAMITNPRIMKRGEMVYMSGDMAGKLYVLHEGRVKISRINPNGKEQVIRTIGPGEFLGELSLFGATPQSDNAEVMEQTTMCVIDGSELKEIMARYPKIAFKVMDVLSRRLQMAETLLETISLDTVEQRIARALLSLSQGQDDFDLILSKGELASQIGMSQESLSRKLTSLQEEGFIDLKGKRRIIIKDRDGLKGISRSE